MERSLSCIILAGGKSKRMGEDKAFLDFNGKSFIRVIGEKLSKKCSQLIVSANREEELYREELKGLEFEFIGDLNPYQGPLNGIVSTVEKIKGEYVFIATCDTPQLKEELIELYLNMIDGFDAVIPEIDGKLQPLNTLYHKTALEKSKESFKDSRSLLSWVSRLNFFVPPIEEINKIDKELGSYRSINTKQDYLNLLRKT